jgi:hypothetical protein
MECFWVDAGPVAKRTGFHRRPQAEGEMADASRPSLMLACADGAPLKRGSSSGEGRRHRVRFVTQVADRCVIFRRGVIN